MNYELRMGNLETVNKVIRLMFLFAMGVVVVVLSSAKINLGFRVLAVISGSMEPAVKTGSLVFAVPRSFGNYREGDVVSFDSGQGRLITHRVLEVSNGRYRTKGDANRQADRHWIYQDQMVGQVLFTIPWLGYLLQFGHSLPGLILLVHIPALWLIAGELGKIKLILTGRKGNVVALPPAFLVVSLVSCLPLGVARSMFSDRDVFAGNYFKAEWSGVNAGQIVINEVAWMGTAASPADEWLELYNPADADVDLEGWGIYERRVEELEGTAGGGETVVDTLVEPLSGALVSGGYYLVERSDDNTISDISASQTPSGWGGSGLHNEGEYLLLKNALGEVIDEIDCSGGWYAGDNSTKASMERIDPDGAGSDPNNWGTNDGITVNGLDADGNAIAGTPGEVNSVVLGL